LACWTLESEICIIASLKCLSEIILNHVNRL
jgi:hypothetical protein